MPVLLALFLFSPLAYGQGTRYDTFFLKPLPAGGVTSVSGLATACNGNGLATTAASITSNVATFTMSSNPITAGFVNGRDVLVINFAGADAFLNGSYTLTAVNATQLQFAITHGNWTATSNGGAVMKPTSSQGCAPQVSVYSDPGLATVLTQPFADDGKGNVGFWALAGTYYVAFSASGLNPMPLNVVTLPCASAKSCSSNVLNVDAANNAGWAGSDFGAWINSAIAALPTSGGYAQGTIHLSGPSGGGTVTQSTAVTITSPFVNVVGPGASSLQINCTVNGDCWRIRTSPFTIKPAGIFKGFSIIGQGSSLANAVGIHLGDIVGAHFEDLAIDKFTGTSSSCVWYDNATDFAERNVFTKVELGLSANGQSGCTKLVRYTNTVGGLNSASFARNDFVSSHMSILDGQTGFSVEGGTVYAGVWDVSGNVSTGTTAKVIALSGLQFSGGPNTTIDGYVRMQVECTSPCTTGTLLTIPAGYTFVNRGGFITDASALLTNSVSGTYIQPFNSFPTRTFNTLRFFSSGGGGNAVDLVVNNPSSNVTLAIPALTANDTLATIGATQTLASKTLASPVVTTGISQGSGFKHQRFGATNATAASAGATSTTTYTWTSAFADASYTVSCVGVSPTGTPSGDINATQIAASIVFRVTAITAVASSYAAVDCIAVHD
jgi:hypothetical protein